MALILHAADLHLDSPFRSLPAPEAARRRAQQRELLEALRDLVLERRADLVLLPGDLLDGRETYPETVSLLARTLTEMAVPVVIAPGNHDFWSEKSPYATQPWPENVHIFSSEALSSFSFPDIGVTVYGAAFTGPSRETDPLEGFTLPEDGGLSLMALHGEVDGRGGYGPISTQSIAKSGLTYLALGHIHQCSGLQRAGETFWAYPGCPQGRGFDETGDKGVLLVEASSSGVSAQFCPLPGPRYRVLSAPVTGRPPAQALLDALGEDCREDYCRVTFTGEAQGLDLPALRALGEPLCRSLELRDETVISRDLWLRAGEETLTGLFLRELRARLDAAQDDGQRRLLELAARYGLAALEGREALI